MKRLVFKDPENWNRGFYLNSELNEKDFIVTESGKLELCIPVLKQNEKSWNDVIKEGNILYIGMLENGFYEDKIENEKFNLVEPNEDSIKLNIKNGEAFYVFKFYFHKMPTKVK